MTLQINKIDVSNFQNSKHFTFMEGAVKNFETFLLGDEFLKGGKPLRREEDATAFTRLVGEFKAKFAKEDEVFSLSKKSSLTAQIASCDKERDDLYTVIKNGVKLFLSFPDEEKQKAAKNVSSALDLYKVNISDALDKETGLLTNLLTELKGKYKDDVALLGFTDVVEKMNAANEEVKSLVDQKDAEKGTKEIGALKAARQECDAAYRDCVEYINALCVIDGDEDYKEFFKKFNALINRTKK